MPGADVRRGVRRSVETWLSLEVVGLIGALAVFLGITAHYALAMPLFYPIDEQAHLGYAHVVAEGRLPTIETADPVPSDATLWQARLDASSDDRYRTVWVANHPPLAALVTAPVARVARVLGWEDGGLMALRYANMAAAAAGIVVVYFLGVELAAGDRRIGLAAATFVALLPQPHLLFAHGQNDGLGFATTAAVLLAAVLYARRGHSERTLAALGVAVALAASTRAAGLILGVAIVAALVALRLVRGPGGLAQRVRAGAVVGAAGLGPTALVMGWFYARNVHLYGDLGGSEYLLRRFDRLPIGSYWDTASSEGLWRHVIDQLTGRTFKGPMLDDPHPTVAVAVLVFAAAALGLALAARRRPAGALPTAAGAVLCLVPVPVVAAILVQHVAGGGMVFARYLYPALAGAAAAVALGLDRLVPRVAPAVVAAGQGLVLLQVVRATSREFDMRTLKVPSSYRMVPGTPGERAAVLVLAVVGAVVLAGATVRSVVEARRGRGAPLEAAAEAVAVEAAAPAGTDG